MIGSPPLMALPALSPPLVTTEPLPAGESQAGLSIAYAALALFALVLLVSWMWAKVRNWWYRRLAAPGRGAPAPVPAPGRRVPDDAGDQARQLHDALLHHQRQARAIEAALYGLRGQVGVEGWVASEIRSIEGTAAQLRHDLGTTIGHAGQVADTLDGR